MSKIKTILIGTSEFAARIYERIYDRIYDRIYEKFDIIAVITTPDKPVGRKQILTASPVKKWALEHNLPVSQLEKIKTLKPDLIIVTAYGQIIPKEILEITSPRQGRGKFGALNIHPSLLPKYRGASPIQTAILNGDKETGVTVMLMDEKMDHGPILGNSKFEIRNSKFIYEELSEKLADLGAELLIKILPNYINGKIKPKPQDHSKATFTKIIKKEDGKIDWKKSAIEIERQIRAYQEWPGCYAQIQNAMPTLPTGQAGGRQAKSHAYRQAGKMLNKLKILNAKIQNKNTDHKIGEVFLDENKNFKVQTDDGVLIVKQLQLEGKKPMPAKDFLNGHPDIVNTILK